MFYPVTQKKVEHVLCSASKTSLVRNFMINNIVSQRLEIPPSPASPVPSSKKGIWMWLHKVSAALNKLLETFLPLRDRPYQSYQKHCKVSAKAPDNPYKTLLSPWTLVWLLFVRPCCTLSLMLHLDLASQGEFWQTWWLIVQAWRSKITDT